MKSFGSAILLSALGALCANGIAFGQAPSQKSGVGEPIGDQERNAAEPIVARVARGASALPRPQPGQGNPLWTIPLESLRETRDRPLFSATRRPPPPVVAEAPKASAPDVRPAAGGARKAPGHVGRRGAWAWPGLGGFGRRGGQVAGEASGRAVRPRMDRAWSRRKGGDARKGAAAGKTRIAGAQRRDGRKGADPGRHCRRRRGAGPVGCIKPFATADRFK